MKKFYILVDGTAQEVDVNATLASTSFTLEQIVEQEGWTAVWSYSTTAAMKKFKRYGFL